MALGVIFGVSYSFAAFFESLSAQFGANRPLVEDYARQAREAFQAEWERERPREMEPAPTTNRTRTGCAGSKPACGVHP